MNFIERKTLDVNTTHAILQDAYDALPQLMSRLAPGGWEESSFHQELMDSRKLFYDCYLESDSASVWETDSSSDVSAHVDQPEEKLSLDDYLYICFPPIGYDYLELFYLISCMLTEITFVSNLYRNHDGDMYYFDEMTMEDLVIQLAHENGEIDKNWADLMVFTFSPPYMEAMELHYCLEVLFRILLKHGFQLDYWHNEILQVVDLQNVYQELLFSNLDAHEKEQRRESVKADINAILRTYDSSAIDPLDLPAIIEMFNLREVCPIVLAYLHAYGEFPKGYPYLLTEYQGYL